MAGDRRYINHERNIQEFRGNKDEATFHSDLLKDVKSKRLELEHITRSLKALTHFASNLEDELKTVHERIRAVNPLWQRLLKRIVIDPRFAGTELDNYKKNRKQHANINVPLHGKEIFASEVASEAQVTDLQLTFMLAMAQKHS